MKIEYDEESDKRRYYDDGGKEIGEGDTIILNGKEEKVYATTDGFLGTDATNPAWIEKGRAYRCEYGIYPLNRDDKAKIIKKNKNSTVGKRQV